MLFLLLHRALTLIILGRSPVDPRTRNFRRENKQEKQHPKARPRKTEANFSSDKTLLGQFMQHSQEKCEIFMIKGTQTPAIVDI